ncbi:MAG: LicD family protein [Lachnospiraceae bacterium]|nr:LicD family protein [Lachnospiraceae bacterium]
MKFDSTYFRDEIRDGFFVHSFMKRAWAAQIEVMNDFDEACKKHGLQYWADAGTMLGAVRHNGCIPWDDDIDIAMKREDYEKFMEVGLSDMPDCYNAIGGKHNESNEWWEFITRVINEKTIHFNDERLNKYHGYMYNAGLDIFVFDAIPDDEKERAAFKEELEVLLDVTAAVAADDSNVEECEGLLSTIERKYNVKIDRSYRVKNQLFQFTEDQFKRYSGINVKDYVQIVRWIYWGDKHIMPNDMISDLVRLDFENTTVPAPRRYNEALMTYFGADYMPFVRKWEGHVYPMYVKQAKILEEETGATLKRFKTSIKSLVECEKEEREDFTALSTQFSDLMKNTVMQVEDLIRKETDDTGILFDLLTESQNLAITFGNAIEGRFGEGTKTVSLLENFCEECYNLSQGMAPDANTLYDIISKIRETATEELKDRKKVLFLATGAEDWYYLDPLYREEKEDSECDITVITLPCWDLGNFSEQTVCHDNRDGYPSDITLTDAETYDIKKECPDVVYYQNIMDGYSFGEMYPEKYYIAEIKKYAKKLVCVPPFVVDDPDDNDFRMKTMMAEFVWSPGVAYSDVVYVADEKTKHTFKKILMEESAKRTFSDDTEEPSLKKFASKGFKSVWEKKIVVREDVCRERIFYKNEKKPDVFTEWSDIITDESGNRKELVLIKAKPGYNIEDIGLYCDDIKESADRFLSEGKIPVVIVADNFKRWELDEINELCDYLKNKENCIYLEDKRISDEDLACVCDSYHGDIDHVQTCFEKLKKPVFIIKQFKVEK